MVESQKQKARHGRPAAIGKVREYSERREVTGKAESLASAESDQEYQPRLCCLKVTVVGDTAVATGDFKAKGTDPEGKPMDVYERFTDTWVKGPKGEWQCVASHQSTVKM